jgi:4-diphosphocytidyl-2-C-methyl-D-erythritol kinase
MPGGDLTTASLRAPAKLTTSLRVVGVRADGYHLIEAEMVSVSLFDELSVRRGGVGLEVVDQIGWRGGGEIDGGETGGGETGGGETGGGETGGGAGALGAGAPNLVEAALSAAGVNASVRLTKHIPPGAGLGGGSSDAGAVLRWARCEDAAIAVGLGADVPFCVRGGRALVTGIGEIVEPRPFGSGCWLLVVPRLHVSTPAVYAAWDRLGGPSGPAGNDLEIPALAVEPQLAWWRNLLGSIAGERPSLAGSGGTWWVAGERSRLAKLAELSEEAIATAGRSALVRVVEEVAGE